jgi:Na+/H+ antiporter NhaD/arsenite permease-like protein
MEIAILVVFVLGYVCIAAEHAIKIDKAATALLTGTLCWTLYFISGGSADALSEHVSQGGAADVYGFLDERLMHHVQEISGILLFLMGAMTIVELIDAHEGFKVITDRITSRSKVKLMWILALITFFLSAALDNLTTAIVMISLARKLIDDQQTRWMFGGIIIIAANAGGAWSPIGDVTTTMLWIGGQITAGAIIPSVIIPSLVSLLLPLSILSFVMKGEVKRPDIKEHIEHQASRRDQRLVFTLGVGGLLMVPVFKTVTHLPPFMGMMFSLGLLWMVTELIHSKKIMEERSKFSPLQALRKIDMPSVLFFLGILLAVGVLNETGQLLQLSAWLKESLGNIYSINIAIGLLSAVIDNVPLVAASMGMYEVSPAVAGDSWADLFVTDGAFWHFLAYTAGTGGSILIIGSAAGVAVMGIEKITFTWYLRKIAPWALLGYLAGCGVYVFLGL